MNHTVKIIVFAGLVAISAHALADDATTTPSQKAQTMKQCMDQQKAANASMTEAAMKTVCKNQMKDTKKNGNDLATGTQAPKPQN